MDSKSLSVNSQSKGEKRFLKGWLIVVGCMLIQAIPFGVASNIQPQFISYVVDDKGFSLSAFSLIFTIGTVVSACASPIIGHLYSKLNTKLIFIVGCILSGLGFLGFSFADSLWQFYLLAGVSQVGTAAISSIGVPLIINAWFDEKIKGKAMGIAFAGGSIGNIFLQQMVVYSLSTNGYSKSYLYFGALSLAVGIPVALLMIRMPKDSSEIVSGTSKSTNNENTNSSNAQWGYTFGEVKKIKYFWLFTIGFVFVGMYVSALAVQYPAYIKGYLKIDGSFVATVGSLFALFSLFGNIVGGFLFDKFGAIKTLFIALGFAAISCLSLIFTANVPQLAFLFSITKGLSVFAYMMGPAYLTGVLFGKKEFGSILGIVNLMFAVGFAAGSSLFGLIVDKVNYSVAWYSILAFIIIGYSILIFASINMKKLNAKKQAV